MVVQYTKKDGKLTKVKLIKVEKKDLKDGNKLKIPEGITVIGRNAFDEISEIGETLKIKMPDTVTEIENFAFFNLNIQKIRFSENLEKIGASAFESVAFKSDVVLPDALKRIPAYCFKGCYFYQQLKLPDGLTEIGNGAFKIATFKDKIIIPKGVKEIPPNCFCRSSFDKGIELSPRLEKIDKGAFQETCLKELEMPDSVESMGKVVFQESSIQKIKLSENLTKIPEGAFVYTNSLEEIEIPHKVINIGIEAFAESNLTRVLLHDGIQKIGARAFQSTKLKEIQLPQTLQIIGDHCFSGCVSLTEVNFPESLKIIGRFAFGGCSLTDATLPINMEIGSGAFFDNVIKKLRLSKNEFDQIKSRKNGAFNQNPLTEIKVYNWKNRKGKEKSISKRRAKSLGKRF